MTFGEGFAGPVFLWDGGKAGPFSCADEGPRSWLLRAWLDLAVTLQRHS